MSAIPPPISDHRTVDEAFVRWLQNRGKASLARHVPLFWRFLVLSEDDRQRMGITEDDHRQLVALYHEFTLPRDEARKAADARKKSNEAAIAAKDVPRTEQEKRRFPMRKIPKGFAG